MEFYVLFVSRIIYNNARLWITAFSVNGIFFSAGEQYIPRNSQGSLCCHPSAALSLRSSDLENVPWLREKEIGWEQCMPARSQVRTPAQPVERGCGGPKLEDGTDILEEWERERERRTTRLFGYQQRLMVVFSIFSLSRSWNVLLLSRFSMQAGPPVFIQRATSYQIFCDCGWEGLNGWSPVMHQPSRYIHRSMQDVQEH